MSESERPSEGDETPLTGVLVCRVYRRHMRCTYIDHYGEPDGLELDATISTGSDWEEANVLHEDAPPMPPKEDGLWELRYPWREANHRNGAPLEDGEVESDNYDSDELCCIYTAKPQWTLLVPRRSPSSVSGVEPTIEQRVARHEIHELKRWTDLLSSVGSYVKDDHFDGGDFDSWRSYTLHEINRLRLDLIALYSPVASSEEAVTSDTPKRIVLCGNCAKRYDANEQGAEDKHGVGKCFHARAVSEQGSPS